MIGFCRTMLVTAELPDEMTVRLRGILEDHIYAMEIEMDVRSSDGVITAIKGTMKRYTTPWCPDAVPVLARAVGMSVREKGWISRVNRDLGRQGCEHFAALIVECGRCLDTARMTRDIAERLQADPQAHAQDAARAWISDHPEAWVERGQATA